jgi:uncharacterized protein (TIGR00725 family)
MKLTIGVMGSSGGALSPAARQKAYRLGEAIAERDAILITGGCPGLPYEAVRGARARGGLVVEIFPALSIDEHRGKYASIRSCDIVVIAGGRTGTLGELAIAYDEGRLIGVLMGTGGITGLGEEIVRTSGKDTGGRVVYESDPVKLVDRRIHVYRTKHFRKPSCFCSEATTHRGGQQ